MHVSARVVSVDTGEVLFSYDETIHENQNVSDVVSNLADNAFNDIRDLGSWILFFPHDSVLSFLFKNSAE